MKDKICLITGGTDGIGKAAAYVLAQQGATLLLHGRDPDKGRRAVEELQARSRNRAIEFLQADFGSLAQVRQLAATVKLRTARLDVLINNAGGIFARRTLSEDGYEKTFAVNHLAPFLLTRLLLGTVQAAPSARIVNTASQAHKGARIPFDDLQATRRYSAMGAYGTSKLANILFTRVLANQLKGTTVTATCLHPGFVRTGFGRGLDSNVVAKHLFRFFARFARTPEKGAETLVYLASSPEVAGESGGYYFDCRPATPSAAARDDASAERLWQVSEALVA